MNAIPKWPREVLSAIESIAGDDFCQDLDMRRFSSEKFTERETVLAEKISAIYRLAHAFNKAHCCYHVHGDWRKELLKYAGER